MRRHIVVARAQIEPLDVPNFKASNSYVQNRALLSNLYRERFSYRPERPISDE